MGLISATSCGDIAQDRLRLILTRNLLATLLGCDPARIMPSALEVQTPFAIRRRGVEAKLIVGPRAPALDMILVHALADAHRWTKLLKSGTPLKKFAANARKTEAQVRTRARLAFLAPSIQQAILEGIQPPDITLENLVRNPLALDGRAQEAASGQR